MSVKDSKKLLAKCKYKTKKLNTTFVDCNLPRAAEWLPARAKTGVKEDRRVVLKLDLVLLMH